MLTWLDGKSYTILLVMNVINMVLISS